MSVNKSIPVAESGMVRIAELSPESRYALKEYSFRHNYDEWLGDRAYVESHWFAWLVAILKAENDSGELFPRGKWATIQRMEEMLMVAAKVECDSHD